MWLFGNRKKAQKDIPRETIAINVKIGGKSKGSNADSDYEKKRREREDRIKHQDELLSMVWDSREKYEGSKDLTELIKSYEYALLEANPPLLSTTHELYLAELYVKAGMNDKAWRYLNRLYSRYIVSPGEPAWKVRDMLAKILKKEKKYKEAIEMYILKYMDKKTSPDFQKSMFLKDIKPCANKIPFNESQVEEIVSIVEKYFSKHSRNYDPVEKYRDFIKTQTVS